MNRLACTYILCLCFFAAIGQKQKSQPALSDVLENALASVVTVAVYETDYASQPVGRGSSAAAITEEAYRKALDMGGESSSGSGFVIVQNNEKYVVTNYHVIADASTELGSVKVFSIARKAYDMKVIGGDPLYDFALLQFVDSPGAEITSVKFKTDEPRIGERVFAVGNPLGSFPYSVSDGIISAKNRVRGGLTAKFGYLQTTATVIWGNSGGPILDEKGHVAGINSYIEFAIAPDGSEIWQSQINYALEARLASRITSEVLANKGSIVRAYLGVAFGTRIPWSDDSPENAEVQRVPEYPRIVSVLPNAPASTALRSKIGWQVTVVNGDEVRNMEELFGLLESVKPNQEVTLTLARDSVTVETVKVRSTDLRNEHLEEIALHLLKQETAISFIDNVPFVGLNFKPSRFQLVENEEEISHAVSSFGTQSRWKVVACGRRIAGGYNMYKVVELKDVGAAIRLTSLSGQLDVSMIPDTETDITNMRQFRLTFSGEPGEILSLLYY